MIWMLIPAPKVVVLKAAHRGEAHRVVIHRVAPKAVRIHGAHHFLMRCIQNKTWVKKLRHAP